MSLSYLLSNETVALVTWIGTIATLFAIYKTYRQAALARAESANTAKEVVALKREFQLATLASASAQLDITKTLVDNGNFSAARSLVLPLRKQIIEAIHFAFNRENDEDKRSSRIRNIIILEKQIDYGVNRSDKFRPNVLLRCFQELSTFLSEQSISIRTLTSQS